MIYINGLSLVAPGITEAETMKGVLSGQEQWEAMPLPSLKPGMLPANERRRTTPLIKLALQAVQPLLNENDPGLHTMTVFASSDGDLEIVDKICMALAMPEKAVSPTQFHNSVHNAPAGYWAIAAKIQGASVSLSAADHSFAAGVIEAMTQVLTEHTDVLLVAYDYVAPEPLSTARHFDHSIGIALRFSREKTADSLASISIEMTENKQVTPCQNDSLIPLYKGNPAGLGIPMLEGLQRGQTGSFIIPYVMGQQLQVNLESL